MQISELNWHCLKTEIARLKIQQSCHESEETVNATFKKIADLIQKVEAADKKARPSVIRS